MALYKIEDAYPSYKEQFFDGEDIKGLPVYAGIATDEKIGNLHDILLDERGQFRYLVIDTGFWIFGKKVLLPVGRCQVDDVARRIYATGIVSKDQAERLPEYSDEITVDYDYEERVRSVYRTPAVGRSATVEASPPVEAAGVKSAAIYDRNTYTYDREPELYQTNPRDHKKLRLYEERLVADKERRKAGEVAIGKHVETKSARASVPVEKERVTIERTTPTRQRPVVPGEANFQDEVIARVDVYEETADIHKETVVSQEVNVKKVVERDTVEATEVLHRERLDVQTKGKPIVEK
ncbi:MAG: DUF2382 domain-containing protein [Cyanobacteriota bacterium]|nr:DUF2382 domain-containing protein [Cyanobacteriota bacterium]